MFPAVSCSAVPYCAQTQGAELHMKSVKIPDTDNTVELYAFDVSGHDLYKSVRYKYVCSPYRFAASLCSATPRCHYPTRSPALVTDGTDGGRVVCGGCVRYGESREL